MHLIEILRRPCRPVQRSVANTFILYLHHLSFQPWQTRGRARTFLGDDLR